MHRETRSFVQLLIADKGEKTRKLLLIPLSWWCSTIEN